MSQPAHDDSDLARYWKLATDSVPFAAKVRQSLETQGLRLTWVRHQGELAALRFQTPDALQKRFELAPELLFLVCQGHLQTEHIRNGVPAFARSDRTTVAFAFWTDAQEDLVNRLARQPLPAGTWLPWVLDEPLRLTLSQGLQTHDSFDESNPVRGTERFGREQTLATLHRELVVHNALGVYGLRKVGKTSLVFGLQELLDNATNTAGSGWHVAYADAQSFLSEDIDAVCDKLLEGLRRPRGRHRSPRVNLKKALEAIAANGETACLIIDEFDFLLTHRAFSSHIVEFLAMIRGLVQMYPGHNKWALVGREPNLLNATRLHDQPNPTLSFFRPFWVPPLGRQAMGDMLARLGRRMGLEVGGASQDRAFDLTLGHPMMARIYGSQLARFVSPPETPLEDNLPTDAYAAKAGVAFLREQRARDWVQEVAELLFEHHTATGDVLWQHVSSGATFESWQTIGDSNPEEATLLARFGLVDERSGAVPELLKQLLHRHRVSTAA